MSFLFSGRVQLSKCAKNFTLPSDDTQIEVCKCRMKNGSYQLTYDGQFDYLEELSRLE